MAGGFDRLIDAFGDLANGVAKMGETGWRGIAGGGKKGTNAGKSVVGAVGTVADKTAGATGAVVSRVGNFAGNHPGIAIAVVVAAFWKPLGNWINKLRGKRDVTAISSGNDLMTLQQQNAELRSYIAAQRAAGAAKIREIGAYNPADGNATGRVMAGRGGAGIAPPQN